MYSASVTAVFKMDSEGTEKRFTRTVQGSSSDYRINDDVYIFLLNSLYIKIDCINKCLCYCSQYPIKNILHSWNRLA